MNEREVETLDIGSAALVEVGEHVIGRLVPIEAGVRCSSRRRSSCHPTWPARSPLTRRMDVGARARVSPGRPPEETISTRTTSSDAQRRAAGLAGARRRVARPDAAEVTPRVDGGPDQWRCRRPPRGTRGPVRVVALRCVAGRGFDGAETVGDRGSGAEPRSEDPAGFQRLASRLVSPAAEVCRALAVDLDEDA